MAWTNIPNANLAAGAPIRSVDLLAIRDNISAVPNGDSGAPRNTDASIADGLSASTTYYPLSSIQATNNSGGAGLQKLISFRCLRGGTYNIRFRIANVDSNDARTMSSRVYVGGVAVGSTISTLLQPIQYRTDTHSNISVSRGQVVDVYAQTSSGALNWTLIGNVQIGCQSNISIMPFTPASNSNSVDTGLPI